MVAARSPVSIVTIDSSGSHDTGIPFVDASLAQTSRTQVGLAAV